MSDQQNLSYVPPTEEAQEEDSDLNAVRLGSFSLQAMASQDSLDDAAIGAVMIPSSSDDSEDNEGKNSHALDEVCSREGSANQSEVCETLSCRL